MRMLYRKPAFLILALAAALTGNTLKAQDAASTAPKASRGLIFSANGAYDIPLADMADRFGGSFRVGPSVMYKTSNNWLIGAKLDFIFGNKMKEDSLLINVRDKQGYFIDQNGSRTKLPLYERGYIIAGQVGKIFPLHDRNLNSGIMALTSVGFIQHKINIFDRDHVVPQVRGDYRKGYDRLTNGIYLDQFIGYAFFSESRLVNFYAGLQVSWGFTQGRRDYLFDVNRPDTKPRNDAMFGIRVGWMIPVFKNKVDEIYF